MNIGMLWFDNDPKAGLDAKIARAAGYYRTKYGQAPTVCFVHPTMLKTEAAPPVANDRLQRGGLEVRSTRSVLPNHFWIGVGGGGE
jgi:hypothetical protein